MQCIVEPLPVVLLKIAISCILDCANKHTIIKIQCKVSELSTTLPDHSLPGEDQVALMI